MYPGSRHFQATVKSVDHDTISVGDLCTNWALSLIYTYVAETFEMVAEEKKVSLRLLYLYFGKQSPVLKV